MRFDIPQDIPRRRETDNGSPNSTDERTPARNLPDNPILRHLKSLEARAAEYRLNHPPVHRKPDIILLGSDATETRFKELSATHTDVIHLALHGYADLDYPDRSALIFAPEPNGPDDGMLQAREIRALHLQAKLVTLSACDTGVGPVGETDVNNLVNAFIEAGADTVVSTLWEIEDQLTERLMSDFYSKLALHERKVDALRSAQIDLLNQGYPPYFWAGIQIVGDSTGTI